MYPVVVDAPVTNIPREQSSVIVGGEEVSLFNDAHFREVRRNYGVPDDCIASTSVFSFERLKASGGKGGDMMAFTTNPGSTLIVKEVNDEDHQRTTVQLLVWKDA